MTEKYVYSLDGEWYDDFDTMQDIVNDGNSEGVKVHGYRARPVRVTHLDIVKSISSITERLIEAAYDEHGDVADGYLDDAHQAELDDDLCHLIADWLSDKYKEPGFYEIHDVEDFTFISETP